MQGSPDNPRTSQHYGIEGFKDTSQHYGIEEIKGDSQLGPSIGELLIKAPQIILEHHSTMIPRSLRELSIGPPLC